MADPPGDPQRPTVLAVSTEGYLALVDWTGRSLARGKRGALPPELQPVLRTLEVETGRSGWKRWPATAGCS